MKSKKKVIDVELNGSWVLESVLMREMFPLLKPGASPEEMYEHQNQRAQYAELLSDLEYDELLVEFNRQLKTKYELTNLTDEQKKKLKRRKK
tara:strand:+ start:2125 stop:2400 length:276 start_codon:yes stop_codon:yes gene_type:complete